MHNEYCGARVNTLNRTDSFDDLLLCGGDKSTPKTDIKLAKAMWKQIQGQ